MIGPGASEPQETETLGQLFSRAVRDHGGKDLIISDADGSVFTYADAGDVVRRVMSRLTVEGIKKGDTICMCAPVNVESFFLFWAAANLGVVFVPLDFRWPERTLKLAIDQVKPKIIFCDRKGFFNVSTLNGQVRIVFFDEPGEDLHASPFFSTWLGDAEGEVVPPGIAPSDEAVILYTSGSTGVPRGVVLAQGPLYRCGRLVKDLMEWTPDDILLSHSDMNAGSLRHSAIAALHAGCSFVVASAEVRSSVFSLAACISKHRCTRLTSNPSMVRQMVHVKDRIPAASLASLRSVLSSGSILTRELVGAFYGHFHVPLLNCYGMTETTGICTGNSLATFSQSNGSIGMPAGCHIEVVDAGGHPVEDGVTGELRVRSNNLMSGYYQDPQHTREVMRRDWFYTGDLGIRRSDGHFVLMGRIKNVIKSASGALICFEEVEAALERHSLIHEAAVCGFTSRRGDERLAAFIVPASAPSNVSDLFKDLRRYLSEELGSHKVPALFYLKDQLPRSTMGKLLRETLQKEIVEP